MSKKSKNPLNVIFGVFLQEERKNLSNLSIEEICATGMLGISISLYKMMESGYVALNSSRIPDFIRVFERSNLIFDRLAKYIAGQSYIEHLMITHENSPKEAFAELADVDYEFKYFYDKCLPYFRKDDGAIEQKRFIQKELVGELKLFLQNPKYPIASEEMFKGILADKINTVPSLSVEILLNIIDSFAKILPQHFGNIAKDWESENRQIFKSLDGYYFHEKYIVSKDNLDIYKYPFLEYDNFKEVRFIFNSNEKKESLKSEFIKLLSDNRSPLTENVIDKIKFETIKKPQSKFERLLIAPNAKDSNIYLHAFWVFTTVSGNKIGFVGVSGKDVNTVYNLTYKETLDRSEIFEGLWKGLSFEESI